MEKTLDKVNAIIDENEKIIANILHDIKSPLYSIKIALQNQLESELNRDIFETTSDIINYIENFLVNYSFKSGKFELKSSPCDIRKIIEKKIENNKHIFIYKNIHIDIVVNNDNFIVNTIEPFLSSIIGNIVSNIALHASPNSIAVINLFKKNNFVLAEFKNNYDKAENDFSLGLDFCAKLTNSINANLKFSKTKNSAVVNLKIPEFRNQRF